MQPVALCLALCLAAAAAAPADQKNVIEQKTTESVVPTELSGQHSEPSHLLLRQLQAKEASTKGFFEELAQISQNIIAHAHQVAEQLIQSIEETAHKALQNLQTDRPDAITLKPDPNVVTPFPTSAQAVTVADDAAPAASPTASVALVDKKDSTTSS